MTFTQYLRHLAALGLAPSFWRLLDQHLWPSSFTRLQDFESFLHLHLASGRSDAILELRTLWSRWADGPAVTRDLHADHALLTWREYAVHLRDCELREEGLCPRAEELRARAIKESHFQDLESLPADPAPCEDPDDAESRRRSAELAEQVLELPSVQFALGQRRRGSRSTRFPTFTKQ